MLAAILALASCGQSHAAPTPTIEYRIAPTETATPNPPSCPCEMPPETATPTSTPTSTPTPTVAIVVPTPAAATAESVAQVGTVRPTSAQYDGRCGAYPDTVTRWWPVVIQYPWDACTALYIINRESGGQDGIYNYEGSGACGVMQLLPCMFPDDGAANIDYGYWHKYVPAGWQPWAVG